MNLNEIIEKLTSGQTPTYIMGGLAVILVLIALKVTKRILQIPFVLIALALLGAAVWRHFH